MSDRVSGQTVSCSVTGTVVVKTKAGRVCMVSNNTAAAATINDAATAPEVAADNLLATIPADIGTYLIDMPFYKGLVVTAGAGNISISYV